MAPFFVIFELVVVMFLRFFSLSKISISKMAFFSAFGRNILLFQPQRMQYFCECVVENWSYEYIAGLTGLTVHVPSLYSALGSLNRWKYI